MVQTLVLSLSKDEPFCSWFDKLTTSEVSKRFGRTTQVDGSATSTLTSPRAQQRV